MNEFLIAIHRDLTSTNPIPSPDQMKGAVKPYQEWIASIAAQNKLVGTPKRWYIDGRFIKVLWTTIIGPSTNIR